MGAVVSSWRTPAGEHLHRKLAEVLGPKPAKALASLGLVSVSDLLYHVPYRYISGTETTSLAQLPLGQEVALVARVAGMRMLGRDPRKKRLEVVLQGDDGTVTATFFGRPPLLTYWQNQLGKGDRGIFIGKVGTFQGRIQLNHPKFVMVDTHGEIVGRADQAHKSMATQVARSGLVGMYHANSKVATWEIGDYAQFVLEVIGDLGDPLPGEIRAQYQLMSLFEAFTHIHRPADLRWVSRASRRLRFEEALALQTTMAHRRRAAQAAAAKPCPPREDGLAAAFDQRLPFTLTQGQREIGDVLSHDLGQAHPMQRLLQGEVGSGKTVVALRAMLQVVDSARQAVLLAPTEVLAAQHYATMTALLGDLGAGQVLGAPESATDVVLLTGSMSAPAKREAMLKAASGQAGIVIGTHALFSERVQFADLGLVVIDEQHRFGVEQRAVLATKAQDQPHTLVMTATPIPRSVAMTVFGDLEVSTLTELPKGRAPVKTTVVEPDRQPTWAERAWARAREEVAAGHQIYVVCPRISATEEDLAQADQPSAAVEDVLDQLRGEALTGLRVEAVHGRLSGEDKDAVMSRFARGEIDALVSTTVIEVGIDVPNATMMVVLDADRFGVSQLHQLRGRIGRGSAGGVCLLFTRMPPESSAVERLRAVASTNDGFALAEYDLAQRKEGDIMGAAQSGTRSTLRVLRVLDDAELIGHARQVANRLISDPQSQDYVADLIAHVDAISEADWLDKS